MMRNATQRLVLALLLLFAGLAAAPARAEDAAAALLAERKELGADYQKAREELRLLLADQKIAMEELKISLTRKDLGRKTKATAADGKDPFFEQVRKLGDKQLKEREGPERRKKDLELRLRENLLKLKKLKVDEDRKTLGGQSR